ncbi:ABC transporter ATP-binding protein [Priestia taiwanensis]|uniref:ABC transporter ATP-binding protein n=1 Tax=Priestia taiwanensis TaxID=1347902 RepID=A0A917EUF2_9BACI|nr:ABC transporter ATP-binding protein [Priestia taiwanensis]MBM7365269.1 ABC-2 type transport system ATP-binding protein [Priestia taiwanensis]GGE85656.1 ABC transporter ATP-binding protein [Priestia taiwanensis]
MSILSVKNLSKDYKDKKVLDDINLSIDEPGIWALVGPNGVGKTTFLNVMTNLLPATSGSVELVGKSNADYTVFKEVAFLQDNTVLFDYLTGYDHLKYVCDVQQLDKKQIDEVTKYVGMDSYVKQQVGTYSLGMKQHLLLAIAIINKPKLLFLDEPLNGLDPTSAILTRKILLELVDKGTTIILSSHNLAEIDRVTHRVIFLKDGKLIQEDMSTYEKVYYHFVVSDVEKTKELLEKHGYNVEISEKGIRVRVENQQLQSITDVFHTANITILDMQKEVAGSEKRYEEIFGV